MALASLYINNALLLAQQNELDQAAKLLEQVVESFVNVEQRTLPVLLRLYLASIYTKSSKWDHVNIQLELALEHPGLGGKIAL